MPQTELLVINRSLSDEEKSAGLQKIEDNYSQMFETALENPEDSNLLKTSTLTNEFTLARSQFIHTQLEHSESSTEDDEEPIHLQIEEHKKEEVQQENDEEVPPDLPQSKPPDLIGLLAVTEDYSESKIDSSVHSELSDTKTVSKVTPTTERDFNKSVTKEEHVATTSVKDRMRIFESPTKEEKPKDNVAAPEISKLTNLQDYSIKNDLDSKISRKKSLELEEHSASEQNEETYLKKSDSNPGEEEKEKEVPLAPLVENKAIKLDEENLSFEDENLVKNSSVSDIESIQTSNKDEQLDSSVIEINSTLDSDIVEIKDLTPEKLVKEIEIEETQVEEIYPEDLNPFGDDEETSEKDPLNPFDDEDEQQENVLHEEVSDELPPKPMARKKVIPLPQNRKISNSDTPDYLKEISMQRISINPFENNSQPNSLNENSHVKNVIAAPRISLNPFWSDGEEPPDEDDFEDKAKPVPMPRTPR